MNRPLLQNRREWLATRPSTRRPPRRGGARAARQLPSGKRIVSGERETGERSRQIAAWRRRTRTAPAVAGTGSGSPSFGAAAAGAITASDASKQQKQRPIAGGGGDVVHRIRHQRQRAGAVHLDQLDHRAADMPGGPAPSHTESQRVGMQVLVVLLQVHPAYRLATWSP